MRKTVFAMTALAVLGSVGTAFAQDQSQDPKAAFMAACGDDFQKYCPNLQPGTPEMKTCVQTNFQTNFSDTCKGALMKMMQAQKAQQGGGDAGAGQ